MENNSEKWEDFKDLMYVVRGVKVMLDADLAGIVRRYLKVKKTDLRIRCNTQRIRIQHN